MALPPQPSLTPALSNDDDRLRVVEARIKTLKGLHPNSPEIARFEAIREELLSRR
jgi:hypothetical protein